MTDIIFTYTIPNTNWLNPAWRRAKKRELREIERKSNFIQLEKYFPNITCREMAKRLSISYGYYIQLRKRYNLERRQ